jgi:predicted nucleotidyltransferase
MVEIDKIVLDNVKEFLCRLDTAGIHVTKAYLFGSYLTGKVDEWSDIDVAVVSPQISDDRFEERITLTKIAVSVDDRIEPLPFNPAGFTKKDPLVREIAKKGFDILNHGINGITGVRS